MEVYTQSARETQKLGEKIGTGLSFGKLSSRNGVVIALYGDLGSGKTTFMQGLAIGLGVKKRVLSPTFIIVRQYEISDMKYVEGSAQSVSRIAYHISRLYHVDLYRIKDEKDVESLGLEELWSDPKTVIAIEWPEKIEKILPEKRTNIYFEYLGENERKITISEWSGGQAFRGSDDLKI